jgi:hypothetical protein
MPYQEQGKISLRGRFIGQPPVQKVRPFIVLRMEHIANIAKCQENTLFQLVNIDKFRSPLKFKANKSIINTT